MSNLLQQDVSTFLAIKQQALKLQESYSQNGLVLPSTSYLSKLLDDAVTLSDAWLLNDHSRVTPQHIFNVCQLNRVTAAATHLGVSEQARKYLSALLNGSLDLLSRERSIAKDFLWELEFWNILVNYGMHATLEEPDIAVNFEGNKIGIACKKIYSENNVSKVLSEAVSQIEDSIDIGIIAINLDDLTPANSILKAPSVEEVLQIIDKTNIGFIKNHERYLRKYLEPGRAISAYVSTCVIGNVESTKPPFFNARQSSVWAIPGLAEDKDKQLRNFYNAIKAAHDYTQRQM